MNKKYDSTVARIAGNIASGLMSRLQSGVFYEEDIRDMSVRLARMIIAEVERTEPKVDEHV